MSGSQLGHALVVALTHDDVEACNELLAAASYDDSCGAISYLAATVAEQYRQDARDMGLTVDDYLQHIGLSLDDVVRRFP